MQSKKGATEQAKGPPMADLVGTWLFLIGIALTAMKLEADIEPWPRWGVIPAFGILFLIIVVLGAGVAIPYL